MLRKPVCRYCEGVFRPLRTSHIYCCATCRKLAFKAKNKAKSDKKKKRNLAEKLKKLSNSAFGLFLVKEIRRAGTVEILHGLTSELLSALASLRRRCTAVGGYSKGESLGFYELSHIYPVSGKNRIGLLSPLNLTIAPYKFNRKHGKKLPVIGYLGLSIPRASLKREWGIYDSQNSVEILKLARKYLGKEFDIWLKSHLISQTQKQSILINFRKAGYDSNVLKTMSLRELKAMAEEVDVPYFSVDREPDSLFLVAKSELERLKIINDFSSALEALEEIDEEIFAPSSIKFIGNSTEFERYNDYLIKQIFLCIHGQPFEMTYEGQSFMSFFLSKNHAKYIHDSIEDEIL